MAAQCFNCGKGIMYGQSHRHHKGVAGGQWTRRAPRTRKIFKPNLHKARILVGGVYKSMRLCTKCQRQLKAQNSKFITTSKDLKSEETESQVVSAA